MASQITIEIKDGKEISITQGSQDYNEPIYSASPNGEYYFSAGTWYTASSDSDVIILCTNHDILFKKKFDLSEDSIFISRVFDNGLVLICTENGVIILYDITGKQIYKSKTQIYAENGSCGITPDFLYLFGEVDNDKSDQYGLHILPFTEMKHIKVNLPPHEYFYIEDEELCTDTAYPEKISVADHTITVYYDDPDCTTILFDGNGKAISVSSRKS